jgi:hypothetical protein
MSGSSSSSTGAAEKKQRLAQTPTAVNSLQLVRGRNLPLALELAVLPFVPTDCLETLYLLSKDTKALVETFFENATHLDFTWSPDEDHFIEEHKFFWLLLLRCKQLRTLKMVTGRLRSG